MKRPQKKVIIQQYQQHAKDTGSAEVQVAIITHRISHLTEHLKLHKKDNHSRRGLYMLVGKRRRLINYLKSNDPVSYQKVAEELGLRASA